LLFLQFLLIILFLIFQRLIFHIFWTLVSEGAIKFIELLFKGLIYDLCINSQLFNICLFFVDFRAVFVNILYLINAGFLKLVELVFQNLT
jgi:hypothetical protein